ncbi:MAG: AraC family transcriptional regulator [Firmicutes bacterium]|nr:AraC family transcriptional regulator [Bacillota bacterium]
MAAAQSYYLNLNGDDNVSRDDLPLIPNCAGLCVLPGPFTGRAALGREDFYLQYLTRGTMDVWIGGSVHLMRPGQVILYYPHTAYQYTMHVPQDGAPQEVQYYWVHFTGRDAASLVERCGVPNQTMIEAADGLTLQIAYEGLFQDFIRRDSLFELSTSSKISSLLVEIGRQVVPVSTAWSDERIRTSLGLIHQSFGEDLSMEQLAQEAHLSESRFRALFKEQTGVSPKEYLTSLRISRARMLLEQTGQSLGEIAAAVGYPDQLYFSRIFRERVGISPSEYRRVGREEACDF